MPRRSASSRLAATFTRVAQRNLQSFTQATLRNSKKVDTQVQRAVAKQHEPPTGAGDWLAGTTIGMPEY